VAGAIVVLTDEGRRMTEESVAASGDNHALGFTLFASRATEDQVSNAKLRLGRVLTRNTDRHSSCSGVQIRRWDQPGRWKH
jgi:hypothetical protein